VFCAEQAVFTNPPIRSTNICEQGTEQRVYMSFDKLGANPMQNVVNSLLEEWNAIAQLYAIVLDFAQAYDGTSTDNNNDIYLFYMT